MRMRLGARATGIKEKDDGEEHQKDEVSWVKRVKTNNMRVKEQEDQAEDED